MRLEGIGGREGPAGYPEGWVDIHPSKTNMQDGLLPVINGVITLLIGVISCNSTSNWYVPTLSKWKFG